MAFIGVRDQPSTTVCAYSVSRTFLHLKASMSDLELGGAHGACWLSMIDRSIGREAKAVEMSSLSRRACYKCGNVGHYAGQ